MGKLKTFWDWWIQVRPIHKALVGFCVYIPMYFLARVFIYDVKLTSNFVGELLQALVWASLTAIVILFVDSRKKHKQ